MPNGLEPPTDITWKRMGASKDMIDQTGGDLRFPEKWRSSIAVFYHEPRKKLPPDYDNRRITYLKIVCTITNFQLPSLNVIRKSKNPAVLAKYFGKDIVELDKMAQKFAQFPAWKKFEARVTDSYPCYGALLQATVFPNSQNPVEPQDFPYIIGFQPRKREMYEVVSESGEALSQSDTRLNLTQGTTSTKTLENYDLDLGYSASGHIMGCLPIPGVLELGGEYEKKQTVGTIQRAQDQIQDIRTTDTSRNKAESYSYTTSLNQLYSLLQGYHLGTNRAVFFMQPRPHIQDAKFTFIRGLRRLEGVQEFFLIVNRPTSVPGLCVEVALETAHMFARRAYQPRIIPGTELYSNPNYLNKTAQALPIDLNIEPYAIFQRRVERWNELPLKYRFLVHQFVHHMKPYVETYPNQYINTAMLANWSIQQYGSIEGALDVIWVSGNIPDLWVDDAALIFEEYEADDGHFFVTSRQLCSCMTTKPSDIDLEESKKEHISACGDSFSIVYESPYDGPVVSTYLVSGVRKTMALTQNQFMKDVNHCLASSIGSPERLPYGESNFLSTDFMLDELSQMIRLLGKAKVKDSSLAKIASFKPFLEKGLGKLSKAKTVVDLGSLSTEDIARDMGISTADAKKTRRKILVNGLSALDARSIDPKAPRQNPIVERLVTQFPKAKLREIERSAGIDRQKLKLRKRFAQ